MRGRLPHKGVFTPEGGCCWMYVYLRDNSVSQLVTLGMIPLPCSTPRTLRTLYAVHTDMGK